MDVSQREFQSRVTKIVNHHRGLAAGMTYYIDATGLMRAKSTRVGPRFPILQLMALVGLGLALKVTALIVIGPSAYGQMIADIGDSNAIAKVVSYVFQPDGLTVAAASSVTSLF